MDFADKVAAFILFQEANGVKYATFDEAAQALQASLASAKAQVCFTGKDEVTEFARRRSLPWVTVEYAHTKRTQDIKLKRSGVLLGTCTKVFKRGKVVSETYFLPKLNEEK